MTFSPSWRYLLSLLCNMCENSRNPLTPESFHSFHEYHICHTIESALCCVPSTSLSILWAAIAIPAFVWGPVLNSYQQEFPMCVGPGLPGGFCFCKEGKEQVVLWARREGMGAKVKRQEGQAQGRMAQWLEYGVWWGVVWLSWGDMNRCLFNPDKMLMTH